MLIAVGKNGVVSAVLSAGDADFAVPLLAPGDAHKYDLYDGTNFSTNPQAAVLKAADDKRLAIVKQLQTADSATVNSVDDLINPTP